MAPHNPEEWPILFDEHVAAGDLQQVTAMYEPNAKVVPPGGNAPVGIEGIHTFLSGLVSRRAQLNGRVVRATIVDDIALLYTDWEDAISSHQTDGKTCHKAIEVLRRQPDGSWKLIIGDPMGRD